MGTAAATTKVSATTAATTEVSAATAAANMSATTAAADHRLSRQQQSPSKEIGLLRPRWS